MIMRKIFVAITLIALALGSTGLRVSAQESAQGQDSLTPAEHKRLFREGAKLWPVYCNTCHNARPGSEKAPYEWDQIMMHMRTLGNLPPEDAQAILEYLKAR
jgi:mono/diheme cytochrome c family protein